MVEKSITVMNKSGLHARPASILVQTALKYPCSIQIFKSDKPCNAKSILDVLKACITAGTEIRLVCNGEQEQQALDTLCAEIEAGLGEQK